MSFVEVREAVPAEWTAVGALTVEAYRRDGLVSGSYLATMGDTFARAHDPFTRVLVAVAGDRLLGAVTYTTPGSRWADVGGPGEAGFRMLAVDHDARGAGVGSALVRACLEQARRDRLTRVAILTTARMDAGIRLYGRLGFRRTPARDPDFPGVPGLLAYVLDLADVTVREAVPADFERVGELTVLAYLADGLVAPDHDYTDELRAAADRAANAVLLVAVDTHDVVGSVTFCRAGTPYAELAQPGESEFRMLAVPPGQRRRGAAEALVHACFDRSREAGDSAIVLSTMDLSPGAHRLYRRLGFVEVPERDWEPIPDLWLRAYRRDLRVERR